MYRARNLRNRKNCQLLFEGVEGLPVFVFDTETTGKNPADSYIVELAAIKFKVYNCVLQEVERLHLYIKPPMPLQQVIIDIHHITNEFLEDKPQEETIFPVVKDFFGENPIVVGHNIDFDVDMLKAMYRRNGMEFTTTVSLDTLEMARDLVFGNDVKDYKLSTLTELYGLEAGLTFHNAMDDVIATVRLLNVFYDEYNKLPRISPKQHIYVNSVHYWKGYNKNQMGIYLNTSLGKMFFSTNRKAWFSSEVNLETVDIDCMEKELLQKMELSSMKEFGRLTEKKFKDLKERLREKRVYL